MTLLNSENATASSLLLGEHYDAVVDYVLDVLRRRVEEGGR